MGDTKSQDVLTQLPETYSQFFMQPSAQPQPTTVVSTDIYCTYVPHIIHDEASENFSFSPITQHTIDHPHHIIEHTRNDHTQLNVIDFQSLIDTKLIRLSL